MNKYNQLLAQCLMCSYLYYHCNKNVVSDSDYDSWMLDLKVNFNNCTHRLKALIDIEILKTSTSLYYIREHEYPNGLKNLAWNWYNLIYPDEMRPVCLNKVKKRKSTDE